jgi:hypothetical protein
VGRGGPGGPQNLRPPASIAIAGAVLLLLLFLLLLLQQDPADPRGDAKTTERMAQRLTRPGLKSPRAWSLTTGQQEGKNEQWSSCPTLTECAASSASSALGEVGATHDPLPSTRSGFESQLRHSHG